MGRKDKHGSDLIGQILMTKGKAVITKSSVHFKI